MLYHIPTELKPGHKIILSGTMPSDEYNFAVELMAALDMHQPDDENVFCHVSAVDGSEPFKGSTTYQGERIYFKNPLEDQTGPIPAASLLEGPKFILIFKASEERGLVEICSVPENTQNGKTHLVDTQEGSMPLFEFKALHDFGSVRFMRVSDNVQIFNIQFVFA